MPSRKKINFTGHQGESLAGLIELPDHPVSYTHLTLPTIYSV